MELLIILCVFLPLIAASVVGLSFGRIPARVAQLITTGGTAISAICAWVMFASLGGGEEDVMKLAMTTWLQSGGLDVSWVLRVDMLTSVMLVLVTSVSALVHLYSVGYMSHDPHRQRFMSYLSLFTFFMLMLVTADNLMQVYLGWEGVGLCSYLLIGFWYKKQSACNAAMKAFIVNRVGDFAMALGVFAVFWHFGTLQFDEIFAQAGDVAGRQVEFLGMQFEVITLICVLLFIGCMGKSAQLGLHTWLPDAMEGPTPVSALIHAATMVTAGVFLVARCSALFELSPFALDMVTIVGAVTCIFAASIALTQHDIKRVIAYSTCSQLGYMFFACGVSAYASGVFHLLTHGFFKALLFLGAGSVIHAFSDEQDMRNMGGVWRKVPLTYAMMLIGTLAITGFPFLSGYYSKDAILEAAYAAGEHGNALGGMAYWIGVSAAMMTAFYSWRLIFLTFHGKCRASESVQSHMHESPKVMTIPLLVLSAGALFAGAAFYYGGHITGGSMEFWKGSITMVEHAGFNVLEAAHHVPTIIKKMPLILGAIAFVLAWLLYIKVPSLPGVIVRIFKPVHMLLYRKYYIDELYDVLFVRPSLLLGKAFWRIIDDNIIDRFGPNGGATLSQMVARCASRMQTGFVHHYAFAMFIAIVGLMTYFIYLI